MAASRFYLTLLVTSLAVVATSFPASHHDQRQQGDMNIGAHVGNFAILIIPSASSGSSNFNILDFLMSMASKQGQQNSEKQAKYNRDHQKISNDVEIDVRPPSVLSKLHPHDITQDVLIAFSPALSLAPTNETSGVEKTSKSISTTLEIVSKSRRTPPISEKDQRVKLLSAGIDVCSPGQLRNEDGNCEDIAGNNRRMDDNSLPMAIAFTSSLNSGLSPAV